MSVIACRQCAQLIGKQHRPSCRLRNAPPDPWRLFEAMERDRRTCPWVYHGHSGPMTLNPWAIAHRSAMTAHRRFMLDVRLGDVREWADPVDPTVTAVIDGQVHQLDGAAPRRAFIQQLRMVAA